MKKKKSKKESKERNKSYALPVFPQGRKSGLVRPQTQAT